MQVMETIKTPEFQQPSFRQVLVHDPSRNPHTFPPPTTTNPTPHVVFTSVVNLCFPSDEPSSFMMVEDDEVKF